jgi:hypothetical protein
LEYEMSEYCPTMSPEWCPGQPKYDWHSAPVQKATIEWVGVKSQLLAVVRADDETLEMRFRKQSDQWAKETAHLSSPAQVIAHPSYQAILGMAQENKDLVIRLLLRDLQEKRRPWFWALSYLTQDNPITQAEAGRIDKMIRAWVEWGKARRLL